MRIINILPDLFNTFRKKLLLILFAVTLAVVSVPSMNAYAQDEHGNNPNEDKVEQHQEGTSKVEHEEEEGKVSREHRSYLPGSDLNFKKEDC